ncbi:hypothetical protein [Parapedobacter lycopersici]|uniref:hypothetical protein n=1 Tax=Parapedobacter lycopersici TaxID=1864939 RepID=UPI00333E7814
MKHFLLFVLSLCSIAAVNAQTVTTRPSGSKPYGTPIAVPDGKIMVGRTGSYTYITPLKYTDSLLALFSLQRVTGLGNTTTNAIQISGTGNLNVATNSGYARYVSNNFQVGLLNGGATAGLLNMSPTMVQLSGTASNIGLILQNGVAAFRDGASTLIRAKGAAGTESDDFVTLAQLNAMGAGYLPLTGGTLTGDLFGTNATFGTLYTSVIDGTDANLVHIKSGVSTSANAYFTNTGLGIGSTPNIARASPLQVQGNIWSTDAYILGTGASPIAEFGMDGNVFVRTMGAQSLRLATNNTNRLVIAATGELTASSLAGTGDAPVMANSAGQLSRGTSTTPNLQQVTNAGATTTNNVQVNTLLTSGGSALGADLQTANVDASGTITAANVSASGNINATGTYNGVKLTTSPSATNDGATVGWADTQIKSRTIPTRFADTYNMVLDGTSDLSTWSGTGAISLLSTNPTTNVPWTAGVNGGVIFQMGGATTSNAAIALTTGGTAYTGNMWFRNRFSSSWYKVATTADIPTNYVTTNTGQTAISGAKQWTSTHSWLIPRGTVPSSAAESISIGSSSSGGIFGPYLVGYGSDAGAAFILRTYVSSAGDQLYLYKGGVSVPLGWTPTAVNHLATKGYVDGAGFAVSGTGASQVGTNSQLDSRYAITAGTPVFTGQYVKFANQTAIPRPSSAGNQYSFLIYRSSTGSWPGPAIEGRNVNGDAAVIIRTFSDAGVQMRLWEGGVDANGPYSNTSDSTLKNDAEYDYSGVGNIPARAFTWKDGRDSLIHVRYYAQEVEEFLPNAVRKNEDTGKLSVDESQVLIAKVSLLEQKNAELEVLLQALTARVEALENKEE